MLKFYKYQGAGNDFILLDNRDHIFPVIGREQIIRGLCDRRFGIGADGVMLLENSAGNDFRMLYYNADGNEGSMCGNGGRCIVSFAHDLGLIGHKCHFTAVDGMHKAIFHSSDYIELGMNDVEKIKLADDHAVLNTGSPHYVKFVEDLSSVNVYEEGKQLRNLPPYKEEGINVNFVENTGHGLRVYTYERGVEDETLACGTGVTAAVIAMNEHADHKIESTVNVIVKGGNLKVKFQKINNTYTNIWLIGPGKRVFEGTIEI